MIGQSIAVLDEQFVRFFGQVEQGATSALSFARQLNMVPVGVIAQAAGVAAYPFLARLAARGDEGGLARTTTRAARGTMFVAFLAAAVMVAVAAPLVRVLYRYGQFSDSDAGSVAALLGIYALSIPAWGLHQILSRHFYAKRRMWVPVVIGTGFTVLGIPAWLLLGDRSGVEGMALASTLVMTAYALAMLLAWWRDSGDAGFRRLLGSMGRGAMAAVIAGVVGRALVEAVTGEGPVSFAGGLVAVILGAVTVVAVYLVATFLFRSPELRELRRGGPDRGLTEGRE
jgi:putative peptidoglycan lipid II flippase